MDVFPARASVAVVPGNQGYLEQSQFQPSGTKRIAYQWWRLVVGGPVRIQESIASGPGVRNTPGARHNLGNIIRSQFSDHGFSDVGMQLLESRIRGALTVEVEHDSAAADDGLGLLGAPTNTGDIIGSQFNDSGFGPVGMQWQRTRVGGDLLIRTQTFERNPDGTIVPVSHRDRLTRRAAGTADAQRPHASVNMGRIRDSQFNDGGYGDVGFQLRDVQIRKSVDSRSERWIIQPQDSNGPPTPSSVPIPSRSFNKTNFGRINDTQFNDGGFGDIGFQWQNSQVSGRVATSTNSISIQPERDDIGPITVSDLVFGRGRPDGGSENISIANIRTVRANKVHAFVQKRFRADARVRQARPLAETPINYLNSATNSGLIRDSQFNDGGFGDTGLQWNNVMADGEVTAVHNSLSIQPENDAQGRITVTNISFPSNPAPSPKPQTGTERELTPDPPLVDRDGDPVTIPLPRRTRPFDKTFKYNFATNSGDIRSSQFNDGGFGDIGLQWQDVEVGGKVRLIHHSLSVQPEGSNLEGVDVSHISFGNRDVADQNPTAVHARATKRIASPNASRRALARTPSARPRPDDCKCHDREGPTNDRILLFEQFTDSYKAEIFLQWDGVSRRYGLLVINNVLEVESQGKVKIKDIQFPGDVTATEPRKDKGQSLQDLPWQEVLSRIGLLTPQRSGPTNRRSPRARPDRIWNFATNSGILLGNQFSDGGLGDVSLHWRNVNVTGDVTVVHNTLSVHVVGKNTGPINVSNITFDSGAISSARRDAKRIVAPPQHIRIIPGDRPDRSLPLPKDSDVSDHATNSGILVGGQFTAGCLGLVALQWNNVRINGDVTVVNNVLSVKSDDDSGGTITVEHVRFE
jgi:hypothetical protein